MKYYGSFSEQGCNSCSVYVPENVTSDTPVYIVYPGADPTEAAGIISYQYTSKSDFDGIVLFENWTNWANPENEDRTINYNRNVISSLEKEYGVTLDNRHVMGISIGDRYAMKDFALQCKNGTDNGFLVVSSPSTPRFASSRRLENYADKITYHDISSSVFDPTRAFLSEEEYEQIKGKTVVLFDTSDATKNHTYIKALVEHGVNVTLIQQDTNDHDRMTRHPLNDNLFGVLAGDATAIEKFLDSNHQYVVKKCTNPESNEWSEIGKDEFIGLLQSGNSDIVESDPNYINEATNMLKTIVNNSSVAEKKNVLVSNGSTTQYPQLGINVYEAFYKAMDSLKNKFETELQAVVDAGDKYAELDNSLAKLELQSDVDIPPIKALGLTDTVTPSRSLDDILNSLPKDPELRQLFLKNYGDISNLDEQFKALKEGKYEDTSQAARFLFEYDLLTNDGFSKWGALAVLANFYGTNPSLLPNKHQDNGTGRITGPAYGLSQFEWKDYEYEEDGHIYHQYGTGEADIAKAWCDKHGYDFDTIEGQIKYIAQDAIKQRCGEEAYERFLTATEDDYKSLVSIYGTNIQGMQGDQFKNQNRVDDGKMKYGLWPLLEARDTLPASQNVRADGNMPTLASPKPTETPAASATPTASPKPTETPAASATPTASPKPTETPAASATPTATPKPTETSAASATPTVSPKPTETLNNATANNSVKTPTQINREDAQAINNSNGNTNNSVKTPTQINREDAQKIKEIQERNNNNEPSVPANDNPTSPSNDGANSGNNNNNSNNNGVSHSGGGYNGGGYGYTAPVEPTKPNNQSEPTKSIVQDEPTKPDIPSGGSRINPTPTYTTPSGTSSQVIKEDPIKNVIIESQENITPDILQGNIVEPNTNTKDIPTTVIPNTNNEVKHENNIGKGILTAAGITAAVAGAAGAAMYGINKAKENNDLDDDENLSDDEENINDEYNVSDEI